MQSFYTFLCGLDGRKKSAREATQIAINWHHLVDATLIRDYLDMLEHTGSCRVSGQLTKLDCIIHVIRYLNREIAGEEYAAMSLHCSCTIERIQQWKAALRPAKKLLAAMKENTEVSQKLREATATLENKDIWLDVTAAFTNGSKATKKKSR